jgi:hypothetical protein
MKTGPLEGFPWTLPVMESPEMGNKKNASHPEGVLLFIVYYDVYNFTPFT